MKTLPNRIKQFKCLFIRPHMVCGHCPPYFSADFIQIEVKRIEDKIAKLQEFRIYLLEKKAKIEMSI